MAEDTQKNIRKFSRIEDQEQYSFVLERIANNDGSAEGPNLPPQVVNGIRAQPLQAFRVMSQTELPGQTKFILSWLADSNLDKWQPEYTVYVYANNTQLNWHGQSTNTPQVRGTLQQAIKAKGSPLEVIVPARQAIPVVFAIAVRLSNGMQTPESAMITCAAHCDPLEMQLVNVTAAYTALYNDEVIIANPGAGAFVITLPSATQMPIGWKFWVKNVFPANNVTVAAAAGETIDGAATVILNAAVPSAIFVGSRANAGWFVFA